jgi:hypothetical protein
MKKVARDREVWRSWEEGTPDAVIAQTETEKEKKKIQPAHGKLHWWDLVNTEVNFLFP